MSLISNQQKGVGRDEKVESSELNIKVSSQRPKEDET